MTLNRMVVPALFVFLGTTGFCMAKASGLPQGSPSSAYGQDRGGWDTPPQELQDIQRQGFRDGIEGARKDFENHRRPDVNNRDEYRHPNVRRDQREAYRDGFRRGYEQGGAHFMGGHDQPMGEHDRGGPGMGQGMGEGMGSDIQRRGFQDGMEGARKDLGNHRHPDVNNRDEYRHPGVPRQLRDEYREAFRRGYDQGMSQMMGDRDHH
jgi:ribosome modulation factor